MESVCLRTSFHAGDQTLAATMLSRCQWEWSTLEPARRRIRCVTAAVRLALEKQIDGIVTAPLSKAALHAAGHHYPGHTELLAEMCGVNDFAMMLYLPPGEQVRGPVGLGVAHVTLHQSLRSVFADLTPAAIVAKCRLADGVMRRLGVERPRLGVCALNPHAGEDGLFGDEERTIIAPAVAEARPRGLDVAGPSRPIR